MPRIFYYFLFALWLNMFSLFRANTMNIHRHVQHNHQHHHNHHHHSNYSYMQKKHHNETHYGSLLNPNKTHALHSYAFNRSTTTTSKPTSKSQKLTLINARPFVSNGFGDAVNRNFNRWPTMHSDGSHSIDADSNWRGNNPFNPMFNPTMVPTGSLTTQRPYNEHRIYTKHHMRPGRHVCVEHKTILLPLAEQTGDRKHTSARCMNTNLCRLYYDNTNSIAPRTSNTAVYNCCPGWAKVNQNSHGCNKPICKMPCKNGGKCIKPEVCGCLKGFNGKHCELDINECLMEKPCDQTCYNTEGSYYCTCRDGFTLQTDKQSCKKIDSVLGNGGDTAFEARDLENDIDIEDLGDKINNIEKLMITEKERSLESNQLMHNTVDAVNHLRLRLDRLENRQNELNLFRERLKSFELQANKLEYTVDLLYKCRHKPLIYCP